MVEHHKMSKLSYAELEQVTAHILGSINKILLSRYLPYDRYCSKIVFIITLKQYYENTALKLLYYYSY